jgi:hypothetical protein
MKLPRRRFLLLGAGATALSEMVSERKTERRHKLGCLAPLLGDEIS